MCFNGGPAKVSKNSNFSLALVGRKLRIKKCAFSVGFSWLQETEIFITVSFAYVAQFF